MFRKRKLEPTRKALHALWHNWPRVKGGSVISSGFVKTGFVYELAYAEVKRLKGILRAELGDAGFLRFEYEYDGTLTLSVNFSFGESDGRFDLIREIFYEDQEGLFDDCDKEARVYNDLRFVRVRGVESARLEYTVYGVSPKDVSLRAERRLDHVTNELDIYHDELEDELL